MKLSTLSFPLLLLFLLVGSISCAAQEKKVAFIESQLYEFSQKKRLNEISTEKKELMSLVKQGDKNAERKLNDLSTLKSTIDKDISENRTLGEVPSILKIKPRPPCPPKDCEKLEELGTIIVANNLKDISAVVLDGNGKTIGKLISKPISQDKKLGYKEYGFNLKKDYSGPITIKFTRIPQKGKPLTYNYEAILE